MLKVFWLKEVGVSLIWFVVVVVFLKVYLLLFFGFVCLFFLVKNSICSDDIGLGNGLFYVFFFYGKYIWVNIGSYLWKYFSDNDV